MKNAITIPAKFMGGPKIRDFWALRIIAKVQMTS